MATTGSAYDDTVVSVGKTFFPDPLAFSPSSVVSAAPLRSTHGLPVPTERTLLPNPLAFRQPSDEWIPAAPRRLPTARFSSPPPEQPAVSYRNTHNDDRRYHGRLSVMELCNDEASEQRTVHRTTTQRPVAAPVVYSRPLHRGKHHSFHSSAAVVPVYGGTPSRPGGVRERRDASAPRGNATVPSVAAAGGHREDGVSIGASPFLQPPAWATAARRGAVQPPAATPPPAASASAYPPVARAREGRRLDGVSHVDRRVSSSGADRPAGHAVGRSVSLSPPNPLAPEEVRYYANIAASDFDILPGAVTLTKHYTEATVFEYPNKTVSSSFRYLDHPLVAHIVPYIRRPSRRRTVSPEYLAAIVRRALPIFETHFKNYTRVTKSPLLDQFISALYGLIKLLPVDLAVKLNQLILPDRHATNIQLPVNFELPTFPSLPRNTPLETYEYSDDERLAMSHFNDPAFKYIFPFWRRPEIIKETDPDHIPALLAQFRLGISAFLHWIIGVRGVAPSTTFVPIVAAAIRNTALAAKMFPQDAETQSWLDELPKFPETK
ncbi:hypothetical protein B0H13DRAFT_2534055 [Mycena leptocephala]|nr:hypothetical protein B0H13DRAFT_2534055 [Mycena leptocephala]